MMNKKYILVIILLLTFFLSYSQNQTTKDSIINQICVTLNENPNETDSVRIYRAYEKHLFPFLNRYPEDKREELDESIYFRMQMICGTFTEMLLKAAPPNEEWEKIIERPKSLPDKKTCRDFLKYKAYSYIESTGDTIKLTIKDGYWVDHFKDGTFSKLKFYWLTDCEFEIEFIESNNTIRKNLSKKGDRYKYYIIDKGSNYHYLAVDIPATDKLLGFKIYH